jgi:cytochrome c553
MVAGGKLLYEKDCVQCHQPNGEGVQEMFYPVLAGQHYNYLLRQMTDIRDGKRGNAHPDMVRVAKKYNYDQLLAISAYQASLATPKSMLMTHGSMCKTAAAKGRKAI